jgi:uncharacterized protein
MLLTFSTGNYLSFKDIQTLSLIPEGLKDKPGNLHTPYFYNSEDRILKTVAIYGHNSFGKTNVIKAFQFFQSFVFNSFSLGQTQTQIEIEPFRLNTEMSNKPSFFEITFIIKETKYRYRFLISAQEIIEEELHYAEYRIRENYLFERKSQDIKISKAWNKDSNNKIEHAILFTKPHILFLSVLMAQENIPRISLITTWLGDNLIIPDNYLGELKKARTIYSDPDYKSLILKFIKNADLGFKTIFDKVENLSKAKLQLEKEFLNLWFEKEIKNFDLYTEHQVFNSEKKIVGNIEFELQKNESAGSIKYFILVCLISYAIKNSKRIWIDELDARFHSTLLEMLVQSFHDPKINSITSQLIFTTHNTILLDKQLRRDQMVVVEKNEWGESSLHRMHTSKKPLRIGQSVEKEYRKGNLGGVSKKVQGNSGNTLFD